MDRFSTHLNLMSKIFKFKKIKTSIEFGMGNFSTEFLIKNTENKIVSIEMQSEEWFNIINRKFFLNPKWQGLLSIGSHSVFNLNYNEYDFALVDGHVETRPECVNFISTFCDTIVAHDTEAESVYGWDRVDLQNFYSFEDANQEPWTKVWTKNKDLIDFLSKEFSK
jgi:hypothetical protein